MTSGSNHNNNNQAGACAACRHQGIAMTSGSNHNNNWAGACAACRHQGIAMTSGSNHNSSRAGACAACRHQGKRCVEDCILAPHFPAERVAELEAVEKVFELSKVEDVLRGLAPSQREQAANSLIWNAKMWERYPVEGPLGHYRLYLQQQHQLIVLKGQELQGIITTTSRPPIPQRQEIIGWREIESRRRARVVPSNTYHHAEDSHLMNQQQILHVDHDQVQLTNETERLRITDDGWEQARQGPGGQENQDTAHMPSNFSK